MQDPVIFDNIKLSDVLKDIHDNSKVKRTNINSLIVQLTSFVNSANEAVILAPIIREFFDVGVKNDDQMVKLATIVQRMTTAEISSEGDVMLTEEEKTKLLENALGNIKANITNIDNDLEDAMAKLNDK